MDTVVLSGLEAGLRTIWELTGSTAAGDVDLFPLRPTHVFDSIADVTPLIQA